MMFAVIIEFLMPDDWTVKPTLGRGDGVSWPLSVLESNALAIGGLTYEADLALTVTS